MKRSIRIAALVLAAALLSGCAKGAVPIDIPPAAPGAAEAPALLAAPGAAAVRGMKKTGESVGERQIYAEGYRELLTAFGVKAARAAFAEESTENGLISPTSLYFALSALAGSAEGETKEEILAALGMEETLLAGETAKLIANLRVEDSMGEIRTAGAFFLNSGFREAMNAETVKALAETYGMEFYETDLSADAAGAQIGAWVQDKTGGRAGGSPGGFAVSPQTALLLLSTVYCRDEWHDRFDAAKTEADTFANADGSRSECDFMNATYGVHIFSRYEGENAACTASSLSLKHGSMLFILPDAGVTPYDILRDENALAAILSGSAQSYAGEVVWKVPKFSYEAETDLTGALRAMGVQRVFDREQADLSPLLKPESSLPLWVGGAVQRMGIGIDENGVEAAGYTRIDYAGSPMPAGRAEMLLDRPFLYAIRSEGSILFFGIVNSGDFS